MRTFFSLLFLIAALARPARAQERPRPGPPEGLVEFVNGVRLGVRVEGGFFRSHLSVAPFEARGLRYLGRPVSSDLSPATTPLYGVSAGLRSGSRAALFGAYRTNVGLRPESGLQYQSGERAIPATYKTRQWEIRGQYFIIENAGFGAIYRNERVNLSQVFPFMIAGRTSYRGLFSGSSERQSLSLYVPVHFQLTDRTSLFGRIGASVYGTGRDHYSNGFSGLQQDPRGRGLYRPEGIPTSSISAKDVGVNRQFARLGVEHPFFGLTWRVFLTGERVSVGEVTEEWRGGARLQIGLPF